MGGNVIGPGNSARFKESNLILESAKFQQILCMHIILYGYHSLYRYHPPTIMLRAVIIAESIPNSLKIIYIP